MKKIAFLFAVLLSLVSCNSDDNKNTEPRAIVGTWKLIEVYSDPGDGSGDFTAIESNKTITFNANGTVTSNGNLCNMTTDIKIATSGTYSENNGTLNVQCGFDQEVPYQINYELNDSYLIINYPCIEACQAKYMKANN